MKTLLYIVMIISLLAPQLPKGFELPGQQRMLADRTERGVSSQLNDVFDLSVSDSYSCTRKDNGLVYCWGTAGYASNSVPEMLPGLMNPVAISPTGYMSCAVLTDGTVKCWVPGMDNPEIYGGFPQPVVALDGDEMNFCAILSTGGVMCWGNNAYGQLGNGTTGVDSSQPVHVLGLASGVKEITTGMSYSCATLEAGGIKCWGNNSDGQFGNGSTTSSNIPVDGVVLEDAIMALETGDTHTCALLTTGKVQCWGSNSYGKLGTGTGTISLPADVIGLSSDVIDISIGEFHSCAVLADGTVKCWGLNNKGQLGDNSIINRPTPVDVLGLSEGIIKVEAGYDHTCALTTSGRVVCWGSNDSDQLGNGWEQFIIYPSDVQNVSGEVIIVDAGYLHTCAALESGGAMCWGRNNFGQVGDGSTINRYEAFPVPDLSSTDILGIQSGEYFSCALTSLGGVKCWGTNSEGQLGDSTYSTRNMPVDVTGLTTGAGIVVSGSKHTCVALISGGVKCWGDNQYGQLGNGTYADSNTPVDVQSLSTSTVVALAAGTAHTCAVLSTGNVKCWGSNWGKQLGDGSTNVNSNNPVDVINVAGALSVVAGEAHSCALITGGGVKCWGYNGGGQLGTGGSTDPLTATDVLGLTSGVNYIAAGENVTCAATQQAVYCWGISVDGHFANAYTSWGSYSPQVLPILLTGVKGITVGKCHSCAIKADGSVICWGNNYYGALGAGYFPISTTPVYVKDYSLVFIPLISIE